MKKRISALLVLLFALSLPLAAGAASHEHGNMKGMDHGKMEKMDHDGMAMHGDMIMIGEDTEDDVKGMAHIKDVSAAMGKMGMEATHHFMVMFVDAKTGKPVTEGAAAVKITGPDGKTMEPVKLVGMEGHFGADVALKEKGDYKFEVGSKLADGQKRTFEFKQALK